MAISSLFFFFHQNDFLIDQQAVHDSIDFSLLLKCARLCRHAYRPKERLDKNYGGKIVFKKALPQFGGWFYIYEEKAQEQLYIVVRGTPIPLNGYKNVLLGILTDVEVVLVKDSLLQVDLHTGFRVEAWEIFKIIQPILDKYQQMGYNFTITGHSLGGAVAGILMLYCEHYGYKPKETITFGQPKFTNKKGMEKLHSRPLFRVTNAKDPVTFLPPGNILNDFKTGYRHFGEELILLDSIFYCYLNKEVAEQGSATSFVENIKYGNAWEHKLDHYIDALAAKLTTQKEVPFNSRKRYLE